jgi:hypothetical protein
MIARHKRIALLLAVAGLLGGGALWFLSARLSPTERSILGRWRDPPTPGRNVTFLVDFRPDRTCAQQRMDGQEFGPGLYELAGTWHVKDGVLFCHWGNGMDSVFSVSAPAAGRKVMGVQVPSLRWRSPMQGRITQVTENELSLQWSNGTASTWTRLPGGVDPLTACQP